MQAPQSLPCCRKRSALVTIVTMLALAGAILVNLPPAPATTQNSDPFHHLLETAHSRGTVRVLVELGMEPLLRHEGASPRIQAQQAAISRARTALMMEEAIEPSSLKASYKRIPYVALEVDAETLGRLAGSPRAKSIAEDMLLSPTLSQSIPLIGVEPVWARGLEGSGQTVVVVDTGVETGHSFLGGRVVSEACFSSDASTGDATTLCPNNSDTMLGPGAASPERCEGIEGCSHGTHVAGVAAGFGMSFHGVGRSADIIAIQAYSRFDDPAMCGGETPCIKSYVSDQLRALEHIYDLRLDYDIAAVNLSLGNGVFSNTCENEIPAFTDMIRMLRATGIATIAGSGNDGLNGSTSYPGCLADVITVGATNEMDEVAPFSNSAAWVDLLAPGVGIESSVIGNEYGIQSGTSTAAAHVAGSWAILKGAHPDAGVDVILSALESTGVPVTALDGIETTPRIQIDQALSALDELVDPSADSIPPATVTDLEITPSVRFELEPTAATVVSSSGHTGASTSDKATDGDPSTIWSTPGRPHMQVEQITVDLGATIDVGQVRLLSREDSGAYFPRDFQVQLSNDNRVFVTVATASGVTAAPGSWTTYNIAPVSPYRFLRIRVTASNPHPTGLFFVQLAEIEVQNVVVVPRDGALLSWTAPGDDGWVETTAVYDIRWNTTGILNDTEFDAIGPDQVAEPVPQPAGTSESLTLMGLPPESSIYIAMRSEDDEIPANVSGLSNVATITTPGVAPAQVTTLSAATDSDGPGIRLTWEPVGNNDMEGRASTYDIRYSLSPITNEAEFAAAAEVSGEPTPDRPTDPPQSMIVGGLSADTEYFFAMKVGDEVPNWSPLSNSANARTGDSEPPATVHLMASVPSGFDYTMVPATAVSASGEAGTLRKETLVDGSAATLWSTPGRASMVVEQITLDLGSVMDVGRVNLVARIDNGDYFPRNFEVQLSSDNVNFTTVQTETNITVGAGAEYPVNITSPGSGRYVRILVTRSIQHPAGNYYVQIAEVEVYQAVAIPGNAVVLSWIAPGDSGTEGNATSYDIRWNTTGIANETVFNAIDPNQVIEPIPRPTGTSESFILTGLPAESNVYIAMRSGDGNTPTNVSDLSNVVVVTTPGQAPAKVTTLAATALSDQTIRLTWNPVGNDGMSGGAASTYDIRYSMSPITNDAEFAAASLVSGEPTPAAPVTPPVQQEVTVDGLQPDTQYYFAMKSADEISNWSLLSDPADAHTNDSIPPATVALSASVLSGFDYRMVPATAVSASGEAGALTRENVIDGSFATLWSTPGRASMVVEQVTLDLGSVMDVGRVNLFARADNGDYFPRDFKVQLSSDNANFTTVQTETDVTAAAGAEYPVNITPPVPGRYIRIQVTRSNRHPVGLYYVQIAEVEAYQTIAVPENAVVLTWVAPGDNGMEGTASSYDIRWNTTGIANEADFEAMGPNQVVEPTPQPAGSSESFTLIGLAGESNVYIAMRSRDEESPANASELSNVVMVQTPMVPPAAITNLTATTGPSPDSIRLQWTATGDDGTYGQAETYDIRYDTSPIVNDTDFENAAPLNGEPAPLSAGASEEMTIFGFLPDAAYYFAVKVTDEVGNWSPVSNSPLGHTPDTVPPAAIDDLEASLFDGIELTHRSAVALSASGEAGTLTKENLVDGSAATLWSTPGRSSMQVEHITLDLGAATELGRFRMLSRADNGAYFPRDFQIQVSSNNVHYRTVFTATDYVAGAGTYFEADISPPVTGRYVRVRITRSNRHPAGLYFVQIAEIECFEAAVPSGIQLNWTAPGDNGYQGTATSYQILYSTERITEGSVDPQDIPAPVLPGTAQSATIGNLPPGTYNFRVVAFDEAGNSSTSNIAEVWIPCFANCLATPTSDLIWDPSESEDATVYHIYASEVPGAYNFANPAGSVPASASLEWSLVNYGFEIGVRYYVVVTAGNARGEQSNASNEVDFVIDPITGMAMLRSSLGTAAR